MAKRQIKRGIDNLAEGLDDLEDALFEGAANAFCKMWKDAPNFIKDAPATSLLDNALNRLCRDPNDPDGNEGLPEINLDEDNPNVEEISLAFTGGQCVGDTYRVTANLVEWRTRLWNNISVNYSLKGPISGILLRKSVVNGTNAGAFVVNHADGEAVTRRFFGNNDVTLFGGSEPSTNGSNVYGLGLVGFGLNNLTNPTDNCGDPPPPPPSSEGPEFDDPAPTIPDLPDITLPAPPGFPDGFPGLDLPVDFDPDGKGISGDKFDFKLDGDGITLEFDDDDPPPFISGDNPDGTSQDTGNNQPGTVPCTTSPELVPAGLDFPNPPEFLRDLFDRVDDFIPSPIPGVSVSQLLDAIEDAFDLDEIPVNPTQVPYYDCEAKEFKTLNWDIVADTISDGDVDKLVESANKASLWCDEPLQLIGYPDWWAVRAGADRPQLVTVFRKGTTRTYHSLVIPHFKQDPPEGTGVIGQYRAGNIMGREILSDNSTLIVYAVDEATAARVLDEMRAQVKSEFLPSSPQRTFQKRLGVAVEEAERIPRRVELWRTGRANANAPDSAWRLPPEEEP